MKNNQTNRATKMTRRRRTLSDGLCRKRFGFVVIGFFLMVSSTLGISVDDSNKEVNSGRENFSRVAGNFGEDSNSPAKRSYDYSQTNARQLRGIPETLSKENSRREETAKLTEHGGISLGTGNVARTGFYSINDLSHRESGNERGLFEGGIGLRMLQNNVNGTIEGTSAQVTANATSVEEDVVGMSTAGIVGLTTALGVMAVMLSTLSWIFVYIYRKNRLVAIGQPPCKLFQTFLYFISFRLVVYHNSHLPIVFIQSSTSSVSDPFSCLLKCFSYSGIILWMHRLAMTPVLPNCGSETLAPRVCTWQFFASFGGPIK